MISSILFLYWILKIENSKRQRVSIATPSGGMGIITFASAQQMVSKEELQPLEHSGSKHYENTDACLEERIKRL